jgi:hypothetical protein
VPHTEKVSHSIIDNSDPYPTFHPLISNITMMDSSYSSFLGQEGSLAHHPLEPYPGQKRGVSL